MKRKATNKQILNAYGQSYRLMQLGKLHDDKIRKSKSKKERREQK